MHLTNILPLYFLYFKTAIIVFLSFSYILLKLINIHCRIEEAFNQVGYSVPTETQKHALLAVLQKKDVLLVSPTGTGKSAVFEAMPCILGKAIIVVSPLVALMRMQTADLKERGMAVEYLGDEEMYPNMSKLQILFTSPESTVTTNFHKFLKEQAKYIGGCVIDEAHCVVKMYVKL